MTNYKLFNQSIVDYAHSSINDPARQFFIVEFQQNVVRNLRLTDKRSPKTQRKTSFAFCAACFTQKYNCFILETLIASNLLLVATTV